MSLQETHAYDDIIDLTHHQSRHRAPMPQSKRAAQFMPFAALTGYEQIIAETVRQAEQQVESDNRPVDGIEEGWVSA